MLANFIRDDFGTHVDLDENEKIWAQWYDRSTKLSYEINSIFKTLNNIAPEKYHDDPVGKLV